MNATKTMIRDTSSSSVDQYRPGGIVMGKDGVTYRVVSSDRSRDQQGGYRYTMQVRPLTVEELRERRKTDLECRVKAQCNNEVEKIEREFFRKEMSMIEAGTWMPAIQIELAAAAKAAIASYWEEYDAKKVRNI